MKKILSLALCLFGLNISNAFAMDPVEPKTQSDICEELINKFLGVFEQNFRKGIKNAEEIFKKADISEFSSSLSSISFEVYVEPLKSLLRKIPQDDLLGWYEIYSNPRVQEFSSEITRVHLYVEKYAREAEKNPVIITCSSPEFMHNIANVYKPLFAKQMGDLKINVELVEAAISHFLEDFNKKYAEEIKLLNEVGTKYMGYDQQVKDLYKRYN